MPFRLSRRASQRNSTNMSQEDINKPAMKNTKNLSGLMTSMLTNKVTPEHMDDMTCSIRIKKELLKQKHYGELEMAAQEQEFAQTVLIETQLNKLESSLSEVRLKSTVIPKGESRHFSKHSKMIHELKEQCFDKLMHAKVSHKNRLDQSIRNSIDREINNRLDKFIQEKESNVTRIIEERNKLYNDIQTKELECEAYHTSERRLKESIRQLEEQVAQLEKKKILPAKDSCEEFVSRYHDYFGELTLEQLRDRFDSSLTKCLEEFIRVQNKNEENLSSQAQKYNYNIDKLQKELNQLAARESLLVINLRNLKLHKELSEIEVNELIRAKKRLQDLEKLILALYNEWYAQRSDNEKQVLKNFGALEENYSYEEMLKYITQYNKLLSTNDKLNEFLLKIFRSIYRLRMVAFPGQCNDKLDPIRTIERIEKRLQLCIEGKWGKLKDHPRAQFMNDESLLDE